jgi:putative aldouronate transport system substrate-binding protein
MDFIQTFLGGKMKNRIFCVLLILILAGGGALFASGSKASSGSGTSSAVGAYPIKTDVTLKYWLALNVNVSPNFSNLGDTPFGKALQQRTGVKIEFLHPPAGGNAAREQLNLMIAGGDDMPDIMEWNWIDQAQFPGGPEKGISDGVLLKLNETIDKFAPNLKGFLKANPNYDRMVKTDDGSYYVFPFVRGADKLLYSQGLMIRKDWLDELGLQPPATIQEWHDVLVAFKDKKGITGPFTQVWTNNGRMFIPGFGFLKNWYVSAADGKVHYGQIEPGYRRWIETMAQWYKEGLIDKDILTLTTAQQNQKMTAGTAGATVGSVGSGLQTWTNTVRSANPKYTVIAVQYPVLNKGEKLVYTIPNQPYSGQDSAAISAKSKNIEVAARLLDYGYTPEGHNFFNFGIEGESYTMVNGKAKYTDLLMSGGPNKWPLGQSMSAYVRSTAAGPFIQNEGYIEQYYALPEAGQALTNYMLPGALETMLPPITATQAESRELASIQNEINTYVEEITAKWFLGTEAINDASWNNYLNTIKRMNIDRAIAIQNAALDRFKKR